LRLPGIYARQVRELKPGFSKVHPSGRSTPPRRRTGDPCIKAARFLSDLEKQ